MTPLLGWLVCRKQRRTQWPKQLGNLSTDTLRSAHKTASVYLDETAGNEITLRHLSTNPPQLAWKLQQRRIVPSGTSLPAYRSTREARKGPETVKISQKPSLEGSGALIQSQPSTPSNSTELQLTAPRIPALLTGSMMLPKMTALQPES